jgi:UDP-N-acetylglucosamine:LPS N-acetylglucosamine transferase
MTARPKPRPDAGRRYLIMSASMGSGHDGVALELARRLRERGHTTYLVDVLDLLPAGFGVGVRGIYGLMLRHAPSRYQRVYDAFGDPREGRRMIEPLVRLAAPAGHAALREIAPDAVFSTFHLAGAVAGRLREEGRLDVPTLVVITEFNPHAVWLSSGNDAYLCLTPSGQRTAATLVSERAHWLGPIVRPEYERPNPDARPWPPAAAARPPTVLVSSGSWGVANGLADTVRALASTGRYFPLALCGRNSRLLDEVRRVAGPEHALGWREDLPDLVAGAYAVVENAGGQTCAEAFRAGTPVVIHAPLPGHGRAAGRHLTRAGLARRSDTPHDLVTALDALHPDGPARFEQIERARTIFRADGIDLLLALAESGIAGDAVAPARFGRHH